MKQLFGLLLSSQVCLWDFQKQPHISKSSEHIRGKCVYNTSWQHCSVMSFATTIHSIVQHTILAPILMPLMLLQILMYTCESQQNLAHELQQFQGFIVQWFILQTAKSKTDVKIPLPLAKSDTIAILKFPLFTCNVSHMALWLL